MNLLEVNSLNVQFGGVAALEKVSFSVQEGEVVSIIGPNGAGKTTLFNAITGFIKPTSGTVYFNGVDITSYRQHQIARTGMVRTFQKRSFFPSLTVGENLMIACQGGNRQTLRQTLLQAAGLKSIRRRTLTLHSQTVSLCDRFNLPFGEVSQSLAYGAQRRLGIACAIAASPRLLLLDEPCAGMNLTEVAEVAKVIEQLRQSAITLVIIEHRMRFVMEISDRIIVLDSGQKLAEGQPTQIKNNPKVIEAYLGHRESVAI